jgi:hypothetical protein
MGEIRLPGGQELPGTLEDVPKIRCAAHYLVGDEWVRCKSITRRDIRFSDHMPAPADAGWLEVQVQVPWRTTYFACSAKCARAIEALMVADGRATSDRPVLPTDWVLPRSQPVRAVRSADSG